MKKLILFAAVAMMLAACEARVNASNPEALRKSVAEVTKGMSEAEKTEFSQSMMVIAFDTVDPSTIGAFSSDKGSDLLVAALGKKVNGKTGHEVIRLGYETRIRKLDEQMATALKEVEQAKAERDKHKATFGAVVVSGAQFSVRRSYIDTPVISLTIHNGSPMALRRIYFHGTLSSPGRSIPWVDDDFNYEFPGGLEPGETKQLDLEPNMFSGWGNSEFNRRDDLQVKVVVVNLEGASGEKLIKGDPEDAASKERELVELQKQKVEYQAKLKKAK